jgi:hypothetical protein
MVLRRWAMWHQRENHNPGILALARASTYQSTPRLGPSPLEAQQHMRELELKPEHWEDSSAENRVWFRLSNREGKGTIIHRIDQLGRLEVRQSTHRAIQQCRRNSRLRLKINQIRRRYCLWRRLKDVDPAPRSRAR